MKQLLTDMLEDPHMSKRRVWLAILGDFAHLTGRGVWPGALLGSFAVLIWWVNRSDVIPFDPTLGMALIASVFVAAGFVGTLRSGHFAGGLAAGFVAGCVGALTVPGDYVLFGIFPFYEKKDFVMTMTTAAVVVMMLAAAGALLVRPTKVVVRRLAA